MKPLSVREAVDHVKGVEGRQERTAIVGHYLNGRVDVGPPIIEGSVGKGGARSPGWNREGAAELHRRALFVSALSEEKLWP